MNKYNIVNREYKINENILKKTSPNKYENIYSSYFNIEKKYNDNTFPKIKYNNLKK